MTNLQPTQTLSEIAAQSPEAVRILEDRGIDYCCGGARSLAEACQEKGVDWTQVAQAIEAASARASVSHQDWTKATLATLIRHILTTHHQYLRDAFPRLSDRLARVQNAHVRDAAVLTPLGEVYGALREELEQHMWKEERILFPFVERMETAVNQGAPASRPPFGTFQNPIGVMQHEHEDAGRALTEIRRLTQDFTPPSHACDTYRALYTGLAELERDLHQHIHLENNILFPRALALEAGIPRA
jgi:regulator of cell morphogenesis and NO signaling